MPSYRQCDWAVIGEEDNRQAGDVPTRTYLLEGRADQFEIERAKYNVGAPYAGGYIIRISARNIASALSQIEFTVAFAPNFNASFSPTTWSIETTSRSATIVDSTQIPGIARFVARRDVVYRSPTREANYFASAQPGGPRNTSGTGNPVHLRDTATVELFDAEGKLVQRWNGPFRQLYGWIKSELILTRDVQAEVRAQPIDGTPWWRCQDIVTVRYKDDDPDE
jgi:hypothetical protein